jgi:hypothetical protein
MRKMRDEEGRVKKTPIFVAFFFLANIASAADFNVFGFEIGKPLGIPECKRHPLDPNIYAEYQQVTCENPEPNADHGYTHNIVRFSTSDRPRMVKGNLFYAIESQGVLIGARFDTNGIQYQNAIFSDLKAKYGKPTALRTSGAQNGFGASFGVIHAIWKRPGLIVIFDGATDELDEGSVTIDTPEAAKIRAAWEAGANQGKKL